MQMIYSADDKLDAEGSDAEGMDAKDEVYEADVIIEWKNTIKKIMFYKGYVTKSGYLQYIR